MSPPTASSIIHICTREAPKRHRKTHFLWAIGLAQFIMNSERGGSALVNSFVGTKESRRNPSSVELHNTSKSRLFHAAPQQTLSRSKSTGSKYAASQMRDTQRKPFLVLGVGFPNTHFLQEK